MVDTVPSAKAPPRSKGPKQEKKSRPDKASRKELIHNLLERLEKTLEAETPKATLADFIRLTQLERELEQEEQPGEIVVTWKEPSARPGIER